MNDNDLDILLTAFGLLPRDAKPISKPYLTKHERRLLAKVRRQYRNETETAAIMRADVLNATRRRARLQIVSELVAEGHNEAALLLTFNNDQLALLMAWRDRELRQGASSQVQAEPSDGAATPGLTHRSA